MKEEITFCDRCGREIKGRNFRRYKITSGNGVTDAGMGMEDICKICNEYMSTSTYQLDKWIELNQD